MTDAARETLAAEWPPTLATATAAGHQPMSPSKAIRAKCVDCCGGNMAEVRRCTATGCPIWPFRAGRSPYRGRLKDGEEAAAELAESP